LIVSLDREASRLGVPRQSLIKMLIVRHLEELGTSPGPHATKVQLRPSGSGNSIPSNEQPGPCAAGVAGYDFGQRDQYAVRFGYRVLEFQFEEDARRAKVETDLTMSGPVLGFTFRF